MSATCFVMMPFTEKFRVLYEHVIAEAIRSVGLEPRTGHSYEPGSIPDQIHRDISSAAVAVAVLTEGNWNVAYEMGVAHKGNVPVIALIETAVEDIPRAVPFNVRHHRVLPYQPTEGGQRNYERTSPRRFQSSTTNISSPKCCRRPRWAVEAP